MRYLLIFFLLLLSFNVVSAHEIGAAHTHTGEGGSVVTGSGGSVVTGEGGSVVTGSGGSSAELTNPLSNISSIPDFFRVLIEIILVFAIPFIVFFIIYAGFLYVTAQGNAEKISQAHRALLYALIGGMLILGANVLLDIITNTVEQIN